MPKQGMSVTLEADNITWLKARARISGGRGVSALLDQLVTMARQSGHVGPSRSVVGTIDVDASDPQLERADEAARALFEASLGRPLAVHEGRPEHRPEGAVKNEKNVKKRRG